jgi:hypothetical protein
VDGFDALDFTSDWAGNCGLDAEPNSATDKVWNMTITNMTVGCRNTPFSMTGSANGPAPQRKNFTLTNLTVLSGSAQVSAVQQNRAPSTGDFVLDGLHDLRGSLYRGITCTGGWVNITIKNSTATCGVNALTSYACYVSCSGTLTINNNVFNGRPGTERRSSITATSGRWEPCTTETSRSSTGPSCRSCRP